MWRRVISRPTSTPNSARKSRSGSWIGRRIPLKRPGKPEEVATLVGSLFKSDIGFLTGETIYIDGGQGMSH